MEMNFEREGGVETIALSRQPSLVATVVIAIGVLLVLQVLIVLLSQNVSLVLLGLLLITAVSAGWLAVLALDAIMPITVTMNKDGLTIARMLGDETHAWADLIAVKVVPSSGLLSDDPGAETSGRLGVGLFLKSRKLPRQHELDADVIVFGAPDTDVDKLITVVNHIGEFKKTIGSGLADPSRRIRKAAPIAAPSSFRRPRSVA